MYYTLHEIYVYQQLPPKKPRHISSRASPHTRLAKSIPSRISPSPLHIHTHQQRHRTPNHPYQEKERVANITCCVRYETNNKGAEERAGLEVEMRVCEGDGRRRMRNVLYR